MEGKVDKTIVKSIIVAWWLNLAICIIISIAVMCAFYLYNKGKEKAIEENREKERISCMNYGKCWINDSCQSCIGGW